METKYTHTCLVYLPNAIGIDMVVAVVPTGGVDTFLQEATLDYHIAWLADWDVSGAFSVSVYTDSLRDMYIIAPKDYGTAKVVYPNYITVDTLDKLMYQVRVRMRQFHIDYDNVDWKELLEYSPETVRDFNKEK